MDDYPLLNLFWTMMLFFLWIMWLFLLVRIVADIFGSDDLSGWGKAGWTDPPRGFRTALFAVNSRCEL